MKQATIPQMASLFIAWAIVTGAILAWMVSGRLAADNMPGTAYDAPQSPTGSAIAILEDVPTKDVDAEEREVLAQAVLPTKQLLASDPKEIISKIADAPDSKDMKEMIVEEAPEPWGSPPKAFPAPGGTFGTPIQVITTPPRGAPTATPEPSAWMLLTVGLAALICGQFFKRKI